MKAYTFQAWGDARPIHTSVSRVEATTWPTAVRRAMTIVKNSGLLRRNTREVTIKLTRV